MVDWNLRDSSVDGPEWARLLEACPHGLFHEPDWVRACCQGLGGRPLCWILERDTTPVGGLAGFAVSLLWTRLAYFGFPYGGLLGQAPPADVLADLLGVQALRADLTRLRINDDPLLGPTRARGLRTLPADTQRLDFAGQSFEQLWKAWPKNIRRDVRRAKRSGVQVRTESNAGAVREFYSLYLASMQRNQALPKYPVSLVESIQRQVISTGRGVLLLARHDGQAVAGAVFVDSPDTRHYLMAGARAEALKLCPNEALISEAIRGAIERGLTAFDFLPSGQGNAGLKRFKAKWGAQPLPAASHDLVAHPIRARLLEFASGLASRGPVRAVAQRLRALRVPGDGR